MSTTSSAGTGNSLAVAVEPRPQARSRRRVGRWLALSTGLIVAGTVAIGYYWNREPASFDVSQVAAAMLGDYDTLAPGSYTVAATAGIAQTLLDKPGGYLTNDVTPPSIALDNLPSWEFGVLTELRDMVRVLRNDFSRAQTQSPEDPDLAVADAQFHFDAKSWILPAAEDEYVRGIDALRSFLIRAQAKGPNRARFHVRSDNLNFYLATVEKRLGGYSQRLSESVHAWDDAGDGLGTEQTPWLEIDNVFYEARGYAWALLHSLKAIERDFSDVLASKNASLSMSRIIDKLEQTQSPVWSPMIMNSSGFGLVTNHSLVMASYLSRANAAIIDFRRLLAEG